MQWNLFGFDTSPIFTYLLYNLYETIKRSFESNISSYAICIWNSLAFQMWLIGGNFSYDEKWGSMYLYNGDSIFMRICRTYFFYIFANKITYFGFYSLKVFYAFLYDIRNKKSFFMFSHRIFMSCKIYVMSIFWCPLLDPSCPVLIFPAAHPPILIFLLNNRQILLLWPLHLMYLKEKITLNGHHHE